MSVSDDTERDDAEDGRDEAPDPPPDLQAGPNLFGEEAPPPAEPERAPEAAAAPEGVPVPAPAPADAAPGAGKKSDAYRVLARKYRPTNFDELIGQEPLVRTLTNAIQANRIAQAFVLTGVRGVGKTTTARIIAKALNCIGPDGTGGPTVAPCGVCEHCTGIAADRHVDVIEMDAASRTGVNDIRELIDGVRYRPTSARYKVYILDEVHMLSTAAFNALLKTLEEPPEHVKFIFATTEIRKVPVTVLSRCQRFDLRRVPVEQLAAHFRRVAEAEGMGVEDEALAMIARAADGSVRDGLSILDQAIALSAGTVAAERVRDMLGLADRARIYELFDAAMKGDAPGALALLEDLYDVGADPAVVIQDLLDVTHWLTRAKIAPDLLDRPTTPELERTRGKEMAEALGLPVLSRAWQMLMKGLSEVRAAPSPIQAAEMVLIRLIHTADMPPPGDLVKQLREAQARDARSGPALSPAPAPAEQASAPPAPASPQSAPAQSAPPQSAPAQSAPPQSAPAQSAPASAPASDTPSALAPNPTSADAARSAAPPLSSQASRGPSAGPEPARAAAPAPVAEPEAGAERAPEPTVPPPEDFRALVALLERRKELKMASALRRHVHPVAFERGRIEFRLSDSAPREHRDMPGRLGRKLTEWTGERWVVALSGAPGEPTLVEREQADERARLGRAERDPLVQAVKSAFPGAEIVRVSGRDAPGPGGAGLADGGATPDAAAGGAEAAPPFPDSGQPPDADAAAGDDPPWDEDAPPPWEDGDPGPFAP